MMAPSLERLRLQWLQTARLRYFTLLGLMIIGVHGVLTVADRRDALVKDYQQDRDLMARLRSASAQSEWLKHSERAQGQLVALLRSLPFARTDGQAQAETRAWLEEQGKEGNLQNVTIRVEESLEVLGHPGMRQVLARLDGAASLMEVRGFLRSLSLALPWVQAQRMELSDGQPGKVSVIVRSYYRDASLPVPRIVLAKPAVDAGAPRSSSATPLVLDRAPRQASAGGKGKAPVPPGGPGSTYSPDAGSRLPQPAARTSTGVLAGVVGVDVAAESAKRLERQPAKDRKVEKP